MTAHHYAKPAGHFTDRPGLHFLYYRRYEGRCGNDSHGDPRRDTQIYPGITSAKDLFISQAALTGESMPVV
ncbi:MAG: hypothetical protein ABI600_08005, partial [Luteolibacter sp.]